MGDMKKKNKRSFVTPILQVFSGIQIVLYLLLAFTISGVYLYITTQHLPITIVISSISMFFVFYFMIYIPKQLKKENHLMRELQKYTTNLTFYLKSGYNVMVALEKSKMNLDPKIQKDIDITIKGLKDNAELNTDHFRKYNFYSIDVFHQILKIKYEKGGKTGDLFNKINNSINFEIVKRDELYRKKLFARRQILMMMMMVLSIPLIIFFFTRDLYMTFLSMGGDAIGTVVMIFILILISMCFLQRACSDITLRI